MFFLYPLSRGWFGSIWFHFGRGRELKLGCMLTLRSNSGGGAVSFLLLAGLGWKGAGLGKAIKAI